MENKDRIALFIANFGHAYVQTQVQGLLPLDGHLAELTLQQEAAEELQSSLKGTEAAS